MRPPDIDLRAIGIPVHSLAGLDDKVGDKVGNSFLATRLEGLCEDFLQTPVMLQTLENYLAWT